MKSASDAIQAGVYESPFTVALGPHWAAITAGFAVMIFGEMYITPAGERYLENRANEC